MKSRDSLSYIFALVCILLLQKDEVECSVTTQDGTLKEEFKPVRLGCTVEGLATYTVQWLRNGAAVPEDRKHTIEEDKANKNTSLLIKKAYRRDVGEYECVFQPDPGSSGTGKLSAKVYLKTDPAIIADFKSSVITWEGEVVEIKCEVHAYPVPAISWTKNGEPLSAQANKTEFANGDDGLENDILKLSDIKFEDRANYGCLADGNNKTLKEVLVRVKDRYGAVYPCIGILAEVLVLAVIIFIYERRRKARKARQAGDYGDKGNSHGQGQTGDARQRNKNVRT